MTAKYISKLNRVAMVILALLSILLSILLLYGVINASQYCTLMKCIIIGICFLARIEVKYFINLYLFNLL